MIEVQLYNSCDWPYKSYFDNNFYQESHHHNKCNVKDNQIKYVKNSKYAKTTSTNAKWNLGLENSCILKAKETLNLMTNLQTCVLTRGSGILERDLFLSLRDV